MANKRPFQLDAKTATQITKLYQFVIDISTDAKANNITLEEFIIFLSTYDELEDILLQDIGESNKSVATLLNNLNASVLALRNGADTSFDTVAEMNATNGTGEFISGNTCIVAENSTKYTYDGTYWGNGVPLSSTSVSVGDKIVYTESTYNTVFEQADDTGSLSSALIAINITGDGSTVTKFSFKTGVYTPSSGLYEFNIFIIDPVGDRILEINSIFADSDSVIDVPFSEGVTLLNTTPYSIYIEKVGGTGTVALLKADAGNSNIFYELSETTTSVQNTVGVYGSGYYTDFPTIAAVDVPTPTGNRKNFFYDSSNSNHFSYKNSSATVVDIEGGSEIWAVLDISNIAYTSTSTFTVTGEDWSGGDYLGSSLKINTTSRVTSRIVGVIFSAGNSVVTIAGEEVPPTITSMAIDYGNATDEPLEFISWNGSYNTESMNVQELDENDINPLHLGVLRWITEIKLWFKDEGTNSNSGTWNAYILTQSAGTLTVGSNYIFVNYSGDFTNVGHDGDPTNLSFVATGTTPTSWGAAILGLAIAKTDIAIATGETTTGILIDNSDDRNMLEDNSTLKMANTKGTGVNDILITRTTISKAIK